MTEGLLIELDDGQVIHVAERPAQGTRHEVLFGVLESTGEQVVVKLERIAGSLASEQQALTWLTAQHGRAPRLRTASAAMFRAERVFSLVTDRATGHAPTTVQAWVRMGRSIATLAGIEWEGSGLPVHDVVTFGQAHTQRIDDLADHLKELRDAVADWEQLSSSTVPPCSNRLVLTHGDPGPGNYLDDGAGTGILIDWEDAHIAPLGLDLARATFIALLGAGPVGYVARDQQARAQAVTRGYLEQLGGDWRPTRDELRWWLTVAGVQFIHRRWERTGQPGVSPWQEAADILAAALNTRDALAPENPA